MYHVVIICDSVVFNRVDCLIWYVVAANIFIIYDWEIHKGTLEKKLNKSYSHFSAGLLK
jgi:hypothetical protein